MLYIKKIKIIKELTRQYYLEREREEEEEEEGQRTMQFNKPKNKL